MRASKGSVKVTESMGRAFVLLYLKALFMKGSKVKSCRDGPVIDAMSLGVELNLKVSASITDDLGV